MLSHLDVAETLDTNCSTQLSRPKGTHSGLSARFIYCSRTDVNAESRDEVGEAYVGIINVEPAIGGRKGAHAFRDPLARTFMCVSLYAWKSDKVGC